MAQATIQRPLVVYAVFRENAKTLRFIALKRSSGYMPLKGQIASSKIELLMYIPGVWQNDPKAICPCSSPKLCLCMYVVLQL
jgi:hypothetical protein